MMWSRVQGRAGRLVLFGLLLVEVATAEKAPRKVHAAPVATDSIRIDGHADDFAWRLASRSAQFVEQNPEEGAAPTEPTHVRLAFDERALYVLIEAEDSRPQEIRRLLTQRDLESPSDWVEVWLNPQNDRQTGYRFAVNARGVQLDSRFSQGGLEEEVNWHAVWTSAVAPTKNGWCAEIRIPLSEMRVDGTQPTWGIQVLRRLARENETSALEPLPKASARPLLHMAELQGLNDLSPQGGLQFRPYALLGWDPSAKGVAPFSRMGGDARLKPTSSATLHVTVRPDFGQVEQDPSQLNLSAFEIFQQERRQFFLDGRENLELRLSYNDFFNDQLYYSRRIGQAPTVPVEGGKHRVSHYPTATTILGAGKALGRTPSGLNIGMQSAVTDSASATLDLEGAEERVPVAARTSYNVARVRQELQDGSGYVGAVGTYTHRFLPLTLQAALPESALVGGGEFDFRFGDYGLMGHALGSHIAGTSEAVDVVQRSLTNNRQRPDAAHIDYDPTQTSLDGYGLALAGGKFDGSPWRAYFGGHARSSGFNTNDLGYLRTADYLQYNVDLTYRFDEPTWLSRFASLGGGVWLDKTMGAEITGLGAEVVGELQLRDNSWAGLGAFGRTPALDTNRLRGGPAVLRPEGMGFWANYSTDKRRNWDVETAMSGEVLSEGSYREGTLELTASLRPTSSLELSLAPQVQSFLDDLQYVDTLTEEGAPRYIVGRVNAEVYSFTLRVNWALLLGLTLRAYAQPYVTSGRFSEYYVVTNPRAAEYDARRKETTYEGEVAFFEAALRSTIVLRWDFLPGSSTYAVWTREQQYFSSEERRVVLSRDAGALMTAPSKDTLLLKVEWFWGG
jgi:hypothetical protein